MDILEEIQEFIDGDKTNINDNFKKWFRDSKVVNSDGTPKVVYHGTKHKFDVFDKTKQVKGDLGAGFYFTDDESIARRLGTYVMPVYLSAQATSMDVIKAKKNGDIVSKDLIVAPYRDICTQYVVFEPNQIKSVDNDGSWSTVNDNIYQ